jgi:TRAP-type uncharacterized transport system fused permease subunit
MRRRRTSTPEAHKPPWRCALPAGFVAGSDSIFAAMYDGSRGILRVAAATACAGIVNGVIMLTGVGVRLGSFLVNISGGNLIIVLFFAMILCIILGMGMSTVASYTIAAAVVAPVLIDLGIPILTAHLFVLYFSCLSTITPPVAVSAYAAAGISGGNPFKTGFLATKLSLAGFLISYLFVFGPALLAKGKLIEIGLAFLTRLSASILWGGGCS